jgi:hypothetical protein
MFMEMIQTTTMMMNKKNKRLGHSQIPTAKLRVPHRAPRKMRVERHNNYDYGVQGLHYVLNRLGNWGVLMGHKRFCITET